MSKESKQIEELLGSPEWLIVLEVLEQNVRRHRSKALTLPSPDHPVEENVQALVAIDALKAFICGVYARDAYDQDLPDFVRSIFS